MLQQLFIKRGAEDLQASTSNWVLGMLSSHWLVAAVIAEALCFVVWLRVLAELELSKAFPLSALSYVLIMAVAFFVFSENISSMQLIGSCLILTGIWCIVAHPARLR
jgi:multidrug transporter EmrE-like cation transporter